MHPQQRKTFTEILAGKRIRTENLFSKKDSEKLAELENGYYICTPQNTESSLRDWQERQKNEAKKKLQIFSSFSCEKQKEVLVLHPL